MAVQNGQELIVRMMSDLLQSETRLHQFADELAKQVQDQDAKDYFSARASLRQQNIDNLERCFQMIGEKPVKVEGRFRETWAEDVRRELDAIQNPGLKAIYAIGAFRQIQELHAGQYAVLRMLARLTGNWAAVALLDANLADKMATYEETDELIRGVARTAIQVRRERAA